jgi:hypothetical protein
MRRERIIFTHAYIYTCNDNNNNNNNNNNKLFIYLRAELNSQWPILEWNEHKITATTLEQA